MSNISFLYKVRSGNKPQADTSIHADIYVNYWKLPIRNHWRRGKEYRRWLDIGVIVGGCNENIEEIAICLPFKVRQEDVVDLAPSVKNEKFVSHFLGKKYSYHSMAESPGYHHLQVVGNQAVEPHLYLYEIADRNKTISELKDGCVLHVKILSCPRLPKEIKESPGERAPEEESRKSKSEEGASPKTVRYGQYFQFRIEIPVASTLIHNEDISNDLVQSAFSKSEMVDISFNELSDLDSIDQQILNKEHTLLQLSEVNFSFIGSSEDEEVIGNRPFDDCELLDKKIWADYMSGLDIFEEKGKTGRKCISYHWKISTPRKKIFFKTVYSSRHWRKILKYALFVILLSFLASLCLEVCKWGYSEIKQNLSTLTKEHNSSIPSSSQIESVLIP